MCVACFFCNNSDTYSWADLGRVGSTPTRVKVTLGSATLGFVTLGSPTLESLMYVWQIYVFNSRKERI